MANNVVGPWEVDSTLTGWFGFGATVLQSADALAQIGPEPFAAAASQHGFINGFASARTAEGQKILLNAVLRFADPGRCSCCRGRLRRHRGQDRRGRAARPDPRSSRRAGGELHTDRGLHAASGGARSAPSRRTASTCSCNSRRLSMGWTRPSVWSPKPLTCKARPSTSSARPIPPSSPTSRSTRPDCWRGPFRFRRTKRPPSRTPPTNNAAHCTSRTIRHGRPRCSPRPGRIWWRWRKRTSTRPRTPRARRESWMGSTPSCSRRRSRPSRSTTFRTAAAFNWRIRSFYCLGAADRYAIETTSKNLLDAQQQVAAQYAMLVSG